MQKTTYRDSQVKNRIILRKNVNSISKINCLTGQTLESHQNFSYVEITKKRFSHRHTGLLNFRVFMRRLHKI